MQAHVHKHNGPRPYANNVHSMSLPDSEQNAPFHLKLLN